MLKQNKNRNMKRSRKGVHAGLLLHSEVTKKIFATLARYRVKEKVREIHPHLDKGERILDIGTGNGVLCHHLRTMGHNVTPLDVKDVSLVDNVRPLIYDGRKIPFEDNCFDTSLIITVLHHTLNPEKVIMEAKRVSRKIIIIEEIFSNVVEKYVTHFIDSLFNLEFANHPHTNKTDEAWKEIFHRNSLNLLHSRYSRSALVLRRATYVLDASGA